MAEPGGILARYAAILEAVAAAPEGISLSDIGRTTALPRGTTHRLLGALRAVQFIETHGGSKSYVLGRRLVRLLHSSAALPSLESIARPRLDALVAAFGETAFLSKLVGRRVESVATAVPDNDSQAYVQPGRVMPIHAAASAKAIFAYHDETLLEDVLAEPRPAYTENTRTDEAEVRAELAEARRRGYAVCAEELDPGVLSYACPVPLDGIGVLYSVGLVGLSRRFGRHDPERVVAALRTTAEEFQRVLLGGRGRVE